MKKQFTCIVCPNGCEIEAEVENGQVISVTGHTCPRGDCTKKHPPPGIFRPGSGCFPLYNGERCR